MVKVFVCMLHIYHALCHTKFGAVRSRVNRLLNLLSHNTLIEYPNNVDIYRQTDVIPGNSVDIT